MRTRYGVARRLIRGGLVILVSALAWAGDAYGRETQVLTLTRGQMATFLARSLGLQRS